MHEFHDPPIFNTRKQVFNLFQPQKVPNTPNNQTLDFVPFNNQRDKLGRLLSRQNKQRYHKQHRNLSIKQRHQSLQLNHKIQINKFNPQLIRNIKQNIKSDQIVEKHFRLNQIKKNKKLKDMNKLRIVSSAANQKIEMPSIGNYDIAQIVDRIKFSKVKKAAISQQKTKIKPKQDQYINKISKTIATNQKSNHSSSQPSTNLKKIQIDYNLPQLERYHESKKLKMKHYDNFQQDHQKFKNLVRNSLVLAQKIKKGLQLD